MRHAPTPAEVIAKLGELDADDIARLFIDEDIVGEPGASDECPVARYVHRRTGALVSIHPALWCVDDGPWAELPENVRVFVKRFDSGAYPHLIEEGIEDL